MQVGKDEKLHKISVKRCELAWKMEARSVKVLLKA